MPSSFKWNEEGRQKYTEFQESPECEAIFSSIIAKQFTTDKSGSEKFCDDFTKAIHTIASTSLMSKRIPNKIALKKWFDKECKESKKNLNRLARNCSAHPLSPEIRTIYHTERNKHNRLMKQKRTSFLSRLNEAIENGHCLDWKKFKQLKQTNDNKILLDKYDLLSFYEYFTNLYKNPNNHTNLTEFTNAYKNRFKHSTSDETEVLNTSISREELLQALKRLHLNKSTSEDLISNEMLTNLNVAGQACLLKLFNHCLISGTYPWHTSVITPIFKAGDPYNPDHYRAIAVGSCLGSSFLAYC